MAEEINERVKIGMNFVDSASDGYSMVLQLIFESMASPVFMRRALMQRTLILQIWCSGTFIEWYNG